jgi:hypothetical protein
MQGLLAGLGALLMAFAWPIAKKILLALGIGALTYGGLSVIGGQIQTLVQGYWGQLPTSIIQIATISGITDSVGIGLGAIAARISLVAVGKIGKISK